MNRAPTPSPADAINSPSRFFLFIYALSGAAGLIYEVVWTRLLTLSMGHTVAAASTVLAAFMGGLAAGALLAGRATARLSRPRAMRIYASLEIAIVVCALLVPVGLAALRPMLVWSYQDGDGGALFVIVRLISSLTVLAIPAAAMGASYPLAVRWMVRNSAMAGAEGGGLYAANTIGAALGAVASGFFLIPSVGLTWTTLIAGALNVTAAASAMVIARRTVAEPMPYAPGTQDCTRQRKAPARRGPESSLGRHTERAPFVAAIALGTSGFVGLMYEVVWTRTFALILGPTTYAFSAMLGAFITGLAIGSAIAASLASRVRQPAIWLAGCLLITGLAATAAIWAAGRLPLVVAGTVADPQTQFGSVVLRESALAALILLPMTITLGGAFPFGIAVASREPSLVARSVAGVYAVNTVGAIAGALAAGFVLIAVLGLQGTALMAAMVALVGSVSVFVFTTSRRSIGVGAALAVLTLIFMTPGWDRELISSGAYKYAPYIRGPDFELALKAGALLFYREGAAATVSVKRLAGTTSLAIDGKVDASNGGDMVTQKLLAHVPLLLHRNPRRICIVGLGSGVTLGAALRHPIEHVDTIEISPEVVRGSSFFSAENHQALDDPRTHLILGDGRSHMLLSTRQYDVIISEPSNPWMAGVATLFTREFFAAARERLAPGGILCQWGHTYDIDPADLRSIAATFISVFPAGALWLVGEGDVLFIGSREPLGSIVEEIDRNWTRAGVAEDLAEISVLDRFTLLSLFVANAAGVKAYAGGAPLQTDDRTSLEFSAPRGIYGRSTNQNLAALNALRQNGGYVPPRIRQLWMSSTAVERRNRARMELRAEAYGTAYDELAAVAPALQDEGSLQGLADAAAGAHRVEDAIRLLETIPAKQAATNIQLSRLLASKGDIARAIAAAGAAVEQDPENPNGAEQLASIFADLGSVEQLRPVVEEMQRRHPEREATLYYAASLKYLQGQFPDAITLGERVLTINRAHARAYNLIGAAYASLGQRDQAREAFQASLRVNPRDPSTYANLGMFELQSANASAAIGYFSEALTLDPASPAALSGMADALVRENDPARAARFSARH